MEIPALHKPVRMPAKFSSFDFWFLDLLLQRLRGRSELLLIELREKLLG